MTGIWGWGRKGRGGGKRFNKRKIKYLWNQRIIQYKNFLTDDFLIFRITKEVMLGRKNIVWIC